MKKVKNIKIFGVEEPFKSKKILPGFESFDEIEEWRSKKYPKLHIYNPGAKKIELSSGFILVPSFIHSDMVSFIILNDGLDKYEILKPSLWARFKRWAWLNFTI